MESTALRRIRFRLQRQGSLEIERWLAPLLTALEKDPRLAKPAEALLAHDPEILQQMMEGKRPLPETLRAWLSTPC